MTKKQPLIPNAYYHIYNRGNNREDIFIQDENYRFFLQRYLQYIEPIAYTYAYCLLPNHFHFLVRIRNIEEQIDTETNIISIREENVADKDKTGKLIEGLDPSRQFSNLFNAYAKSINKAYDRTGSLFEGRFKRVQVDTQRQLLHLIVYIHRNPEKHGIVGDFRDWPYSSYKAILSSKSTKVMQNEVLDLFQGMNLFVDAHEIGDESKIRNLIEKTP
jgi:REP element-mobilizing transposase RayT